MRHWIFYTIFFLLFIHLRSMGQTMDDIGLITIGIGFPENANEETVQNYDRISKKLTKAITNKGCSSYADCQFQCVPVIEIDNIQMAEGGMKNVYVLNGTITVTALDTLTGTVFDSYSDPLKGHATSKEKALVNAINEASLRNFNSGIDDLKEKICSYYRKNKDVMFSQAQSMADMGDYDNAISLLMGFPSMIIPDYYDCLGLANDIYEQKLAEIEQQRIEAQRNHNNSILTKASNAMAASQPDEALSILMDYEIGIDEQDAEYTKIRKQAQNSISTEKRLEYERQERAYRDSRADKEKDYELAHKRIDTHVLLESKKIEANQQIANKQLDITRERNQAAERVANRRIDAASNIAREQTQAAERIENSRINALKQIALEARNRR